MNETTLPDCCQNCGSHTPTKDCNADGKACVRWRAWFSEEWKRIRKSGAEIKQRREENRQMRGE
jgi:hypothetical protein